MTTRLDTHRVEQAIAEAEQRTSGEIRVVLHTGAVDDAVALARQEFARLGMHATRERNAVLILVAPEARRFALYGDAGIHAVCGDAFWQEVAAAMEPRFRNDDATGAVVEGVLRIGALLSSQFPRRADDRNELPDTVEPTRPVI